MSRAVAVLIIACASAGCLDTDKPRAYACSITGSASECGEGWICGLEGQCRPQNAGENWLCAVDAGVEHGRRSAVGEVVRILYADNLGALQRDLQMLKEKYGDERRTRIGSGGQNLTTGGFECKEDEDA